MEQQGQREKPRPQLWQTEHLPQLEQGPSSAAGGGPTKIRGLTVRSGPRGPNGFTSVVAGMPCWRASVKSIPDTMSPSCSSRRSRWCQQK